MAGVTSVPEAFTFAFSYGFLESPLHSRGLTRLLRQQGMKPAAITDADIIIAHSAGCSIMPPEANPRLVVYVGMPLELARPRHTWITANLAGLSKGRLLSNVKVRLKNTYAAVRSPIHNLNILRAPRIAEPSIFPAAEAIFVANRHDPWPRGEELFHLLRVQPWAFISLTVSHEDLWERPERYAVIINHYASKLAQTD